jgi:hypothetical protein
MVAGHFQKDREGFLVADGGERIRRYTQNSFVGKPLDRIGWRLPHRQELPEHMVRVKSPKYLNRAGSRLEHSSTISFKEKLAQHGDRFRTDLNGVEDRSVAVE